MNKSYYNVGIEFISPILTSDFIPYSADFLVGR